MELATRAYAAFEVRAVGEGRRTFKGWATTPALDRMGDTIDPMGVRFKNPLALLHQHRHDQPIGLAEFGAPTAKGIPFEAEIPEIEEAGPLKDRVDTAWGEVKHRLVRAVSIGFRALKYAFKDDGGIDYQEIEVYELSTVSIPALPQALITSVSKSMGEGAQLSTDVIEAIRSADAAALARRGIPLVKSTGLPPGAVRLA
jgi:HK97 family phage prohead protease